MAEHYPRLRVRDVLPAIPNRTAYAADVDARLGAQRHRLSLVSSPQPYGGRRWWFVCRCQRRTPVLYCVGWWACRRCHRLDYRSHRLSTPARWMYRSRKLFAQLGLTGHEDWYPKPKGMRWATFNRIVDEAEEHESAASGWGLRAFITARPEFFGRA